MLKFRVDRHITAAIEKMKEISNKEKTQLFANNFVRKKMGQPMEGNEHLMLRNNYLFTPGTCFSKVLLVFLT